MFDYTIQLLHDKQMDLMKYLEEDDVEAKAQILELNKAIWSLSMVFESTDKHPEVTNIIRQELYKALEKLERKEFNDS